MFLVQTLINIGMCTGLAPVIGLTLPFLSYGGTSLVTNFFSLGMVVALVTHNKPRRILETKKLADFQQAFYISVLLFM